MYSVLQETVQVADLSHPACRHFMISVIERDESVTTAFIMRMCYVCYLSLTFRLVVKGKLIIKMWI